MPTSQFVTLPPTIWALDVCIADHNRRKVLLSPPSFEETVARLCDAVSVRAVRSEQMKSWEGCSPLPRRVSVILEVYEDCDLVDVFHNSAASVRAQCLYSVELGSIALDFARDRLRERSLRLIQMRRLGPNMRELLERSLPLPSTKVWIHQGHWVRHARTSDRQLRIAQWEAHEVTATGEEKKLLRYGSKAPDAPAAIDLIGGWVHPSGLTIGKAIARRPFEIHKYGFT
jgi:hypothetical protein